MILFQPCCHTGSSVRDWYVQYTKSLRSNIYGIGTALQLHQMETFQHSPLILASRYVPSSFDEVDVVKVFTKNKSVNNVRSMFAGACRPVTKPTAKQKDDEEEEDGGPTPKTGMDTPSPDEEREDDAVPKGIPANIGGFGIGWKDLAGAGGVAVVMSPGGAGGGINTGGGGGGGSLVEDVPVAAAVAGGVGVNDGGEGPRGAAVAGAFLAILLAASSTVWAFYKFKPGLLGGSASANHLRHLPVHRYSMAGGGYGLESGSGSAEVDLLEAKLDVANGLLVGAGHVGNETDVAVQTTITATGDGPVGAGFVTTAAARINPAGSGIAGLVTGPGVVTRGTQSDLVFAGHRGSVAYGPEGAALLSARFLESHRLLVESDFRSVDAARPASVRAAATQTTDLSPTYDDGQALPSAVEAVASGGGGAGGYGSGYEESMSSTSFSYHGTVDGGFVYAPEGDRNQRTFSPVPTFTGTLATNSYQMQSVTAKSNHSSHVEQIARHDQPPPAVVNGWGPPPPVEYGHSVRMASEEIRVDCVQVTTNGRFVVTGSINCPPQVWDMKASCSFLLF